MELCTKTVAAWFRFVTFIVFLEECMCVAVGKKENVYMSWLGNVIRVKTQEKCEMKSGFPGYDGNWSLTSAWKLTLDAYETSHDKWWDITKMHNRWVRAGVKTYVNSSTKIGLRLFKPDHGTGHWYRQRHFSSEVEELIYLGTLFGSGDKSATEPSGINFYLPQCFARAAEIALSNEVTGGGGQQA